MVENTHGIQIVPLTVSVQHSPYCSIIQTSIERHSIGADGIADLAETTSQEQPKDEETAEESGGGWRAERGRERDAEERADGQGSSGGGGASAEEASAGGVSAGGASARGASAGVRLFRAVTGRRHRVVNLVN